MQKSEEHGAGLLCSGIPDVLILRALIPLFVRCYRVEREKAQGLDPSKTGATLKTAEDVKAHLENQLKQARLAAQQVRARGSVRPAPALVSAALGRL